MNRNFTGNKRIIHDCCVDIYNAVQNWRSLIIDSHQVIRKIWEERIKNLEELSSEEVFNAECSPESFANLEYLSSLLNKKLENMELVVNKLQRIVTKVNAISDLSDLQQSNSTSFSSDVDGILFQKWPYSKFSSVAQEIAAMFEESLKVKTYICRNICTINEKSTFLYFEASWKYEPYINKPKLNMLLNGILLELELVSEMS